MRDNSHTKILHDWIPKLLVTLTVKLAVSGSSPRRANICLDFFSTYLYTYLFTYINRLSTTHNKSFALYEARSTIVMCLEIFFVLLLRVLFLVSMIGNLFCFLFQTAKTVE